MKRRCVKRTVALLSGLLAAIGSLTVAAEPAFPQCARLTNAHQLLVALRAELILIDLSAAPAIVGDDATAAFEIVPHGGEGTTLRAVVSEECDGATLEVGSADRAVPVRRAVDLSDVPTEARVRILAVALAELVRTTRNSAEARALEVAREELRREERRLAAGLEPGLPELPNPEHTPEPETASALVEPGAFRLNAGGLAVLGAWGLGQSLAGELGTSFGHASWFRWSLEASYARASVETVFGELGVQRWGLALGGDFAFRDAPGLLLGPRAFLVELLARGDSIVDVEEDLQSGPGAAVGARVSFEVPVAESWFVRSTLDAGVAVWSMTFTAGGHDAFVYQGPQAAWGVGVGWNP